MTRPRAYQINDPQTNYVKFDLPSIPLSPVLSLSGADYTSFLNASVTKSFDGTEEDVPAILTGSIQEPFAGVSTGDSIAMSLVGVNGGNPIPIAFQAGDFMTISSASVLTAARVAARINTVLATYGVSTPVASSDNGYIKLVSANALGVYTGSQARIVLTDNAPYTPGTLAKLGLTTLSASGISSKHRGVITRSADGRGGFFPLRYQNGEAVLSQPSKLICSFDRYLNQDCLGGQAVYGRLLKKSTPDRWELSFFSFGLAPAEIVGSGGNFTTLGALDTLRVQTTNGTVSADFQVNFSAPINSVDDVVSAINAAWYSNGFGGASVVSSNAEPFQMDSSDNFFLVVDGNPITVTFSGTYANAMTAQSVVDAINGAWTGAGHTGTIAYVYVDGLHNRVRISSQTSLGSSSTIQMYRNAAALSKLGFPTGNISGSELCSKYGGAEIKFAHPLFDATTLWSTFSITLSNFLGTPLLKMGLGADPFLTVVPSIRETPVTPPAWPATSSLPIVMLIPETLEFGDIPNAESTNLQKFLNQDTSSQLDPFGGVSNANRPAILDKNGLLPASLIDSNFPFLSIKTLTIGAGAGRLIPKLDLSMEVDSENGYQLVEEYTPTSATRKQCWRKYVGADSRGPVFIETWNAKWDGTNWNKDNVAAYATMLMWHSSTCQYAMKRKVAGASWLPSAWDAVPAFSIGMNGSLTIGGAYICQGLPMVFVDSNAVLPLTEAAGALPIPQGANRVRVAEQDIRERGVDEGIDAWATYSLVRGLNARASITVGDGVSTFGDFNGTAAIEEAIHYLTSSSVSEAIIYVKAGTYKAAATLNVNALDLAIIGRPGDHVTVLNPTAAGHTISVTRTSTGSLKLQNVKLQFDGSAVHTNCSLLLNSGVEFHAEDSTICQVRIMDPQKSISFKNCRVYSTGHAVTPAVTISGASGIMNLPIIFDDCRIDSTGGTLPGRSILIQASDGTSWASTLEGLRFTRCRFTLSTGIMSGGNLTLNTGLIDLDPGVGVGTQNDVRLGTGLVVKKVLFEDCRVTVDHMHDGPNVILHLLPTANGVNAAASPSPSTYVDELRFENTEFESFFYQLGSPNPFTVAGGARLLALSKCKFVFYSDASSVHGAPTTDTAYVFPGYSGHNSAIKVTADDIEVRDCDFIGFVHAGSGADTWWQYNHTLTVDNVRMYDYSSFVGAAGNTDFADRNRFGRGFGCIIRDASFSQPVGRISGLHLQGRTAATVIADWGSLSYVRLDADGIHMTDSKISGFAISTGQPGGTSGIAVYSSDWRGTRFKITNCTVVGTYDGISITCTDVAGAGPFYIEKNSIHDCANYGMVLSIDNLRSGGIVSKNYISACTKAGLKYNYPCTPSHVSRRLMVLGNVFTSNFPADPFNGPDMPCRQVIFRPRVTSGGGSYWPYSIFRDNLSLTDGSLQVMGYFGGLTAIPSPESGYGTVSGAHTGIAALTKSFNYDDTREMLENNMFLQNNTNPE